MNVTIFHSPTESLIKEKAIQQLLQELPDSLHAKALRYRSESSAYNYTVGRLLLKRGLEFLGLDNNLERIDYHKNGKPFLPGIHFNISHSAHQVICAFSKEGLLGVDLEKINPINFEDFTAMFSPQEWVSIKGAEDQIRMFYWFWTRKESIIKALGKKLSDLHQIELDVSLDYFEMNGKQWFLSPLALKDGFMCSICSEKAVEKIELVEVTI